MTVQEVMLKAAQRRAALVPRGGHLRLVAPDVAALARAHRPLSDKAVRSLVERKTFLCHQAGENTVTIGGRVLQIPPPPGRRSCADLTVTVRPAC
jgi:hypothetical protein